MTFPRPVFAGIALATAVLASTASGTSLVEATAAPPTLPLEIIDDVPLGGATTRFDYESYDADRHLLFIAHLGDSEVVVFNTQTSRVVGRVPNVSSVHGVLAIPQLGRVYATATGANEVVAIDIATLTVSARVPTGAYPDGMAYAPEEHKLYVSDKNGGTTTVVDVSSNRRISTISLGGEVGNAQYDPASKHVFLNDQTHRELVEVNPATDQIVGRVVLPEAKGNHGLLISAAQHLAFVACEDNARLIVVDLRLRRVVSSFAVGKDPDVLAYDDQLGLLYVAAESGVLSMFQVTDKTVSKVGDGFVGPNAHVVAIAPDTHRSYFPLKDAGGKTVLRVFKVAR
ncbi:YncE family protein [Paraburkholderia sediminicola]|uniref:YncE family protein n=1 Tax=Paraburkholderia rhynchosiae TaxID=487049 RepID=A0ACC7NLF8_9BURK